jgi:hypothetical protein
MFYDWTGTPITREQWCSMLESSQDTTRVARTILPNRKVVSTVWLGLDQRSDMDGPPLIFETMVFPSEMDSGELACARYATEAEARAGHKSLCKKWAKLDER